MANDDNISLIKIDSFSITPKYVQIANSIIAEVENGNFKIGDHIPSINELSIELDISRDTVERGYKHLRELGVIESVPRSGFFISENDFKRTLKICILFNKLSTHKKSIYDSFVSTLGDNAAIDFYIYNNSFSLFKKLVSEKIADYTHFVILPHFIENRDKVHEVINTIPKEKLVLVDKIVENVEGEYATVVENFEENIYKGLESLILKLRKYKSLKLIFPSQSYYPPEIVKGFTLFCDDFKIKYDIIDTVEADGISEGDVYINVMEDELVRVIEKIKATGFQIGKQVGIISYNETPIKRIILDGLTTISSDFNEMGRLTAEAILSNSKEKIEVPFKTIARPSL